MAVALNISLPWQKDETLCYQKLLTKSGPRLMENRDLTMHNQQPWTESLHQSWQLQVEIVITIYHTLMQDFPKAKKKKDQGDMAQDEASNNIIELYEAQNIKNRAPHASKCAARLDATYHWALTDGNPATNTLTDLYRLVRILRLQPFNDWKELNHRIAKEQTRHPDVAGTLPVAKSA
ncbi:hypothetical protein M422DRAFT_267041 [Sphaerobolus stellatus SS14]|uniref:Unplaced genomic scaffold SPHSTscaffold_170, whole genome shotgun sequence n=1 Tax=Sphaerobolus stellatus (strain SS14) TaxID=990650 RepID=A0A0C9V197_SPHS4|nr:hypothetical protein M422DRAFT_267041 [Sphaerobolus stellatus SS14]